MNFRNLDRPALHVLSDAIGRIDYAAADLEAARVTIRNAVATALLHHDAREHLDNLDAAARIAAPADTIAQPFRVEQFERAHGNSDIKLTGFRLWDDTGERPVCVGETYPQPWPVACNRANADRLAQLPLLEAAAAAVVDTIAPPSDAVSTAAQALLDAFGSDVPDWLRTEASALEAALLHASAPPSDDDGCPVGDPECLGNNGDCHDACESPVPVTRTVTMEELGPEAQAAARHAIAIGADRITVSTMGTHYWRGDIEMQRPGETYQQLGDRIDPRN